MKLRDASLQVYEKKLFHTSSFMYFAFIFSQYITITSSEKALKVCGYNFFQREVVLLVIYLFNHDSSKSTIFMVNMAFDVLLSAVFAKYSKLESFVLICTFSLKPNYSPSCWYNFLFWHLHQIHNFNNDLNE